MSEKSAKATEQDALEAAIEGRPSQSRAVKKIAEAAATDTYATLSSDGWLEGLRALPEVACEFTMEDCLTNSYLWWDGESFRATDLPSGLEESEDKPLSRHEAGALIDSTALRKPIAKQEVEHPS